MFRFGKEIMETWYKIKGYKDIVDNDYEVSDKGRVRKTSNRVLLKQSLNIRNKNLKNIKKYLKPRKH